MSLDSRPISPVMPAKKKRLLAGPMPLINLARYDTAFFTGIDVREVDELTHVRWERREAVLVHVEDLQLEQRACLGRLPVSSLVVLFCGGAYRSREEATSGCCRSG